MDADTTTTTKFSPPYFPFRALSSLVERMASEGLPHQVDKTYIQNLPWGYQNHFLGVLRAFGLTDESGQPTVLMRRLVDEPENRPALYADLLRAHYPGVVALPENATQQQLEDEFKKFDISGDTLRKAIGFYLNAAKVADIPTSRHFKAPRASSNGRRPRKTQAEPPPPPPPTPPAGGVFLDNLHPLILGLIKELPSTDGSGTWTKAKRDAWLAIASQTVDMLIRVETSGEEVTD